jgi:hypothetical protein
LSYRSASAHWSNHRSPFAGTGTRGEPEFVSRDVVKASPAVIARGTFRYDAGEVLAAVAVPTLVVAADGDQTTIAEASDRIAR